MGVVISPATERRGPGPVLWLATGVGWLTMVALMLVPDGMWGMPARAAAGLTEQLPGVRPAWVLAVFVGAWVVMVTAMMLPTTVPMARMFRSPLLHRPTELRHTALAPILGDPLYPGRVTRHQITDPKYGMEFTAHQSSQTKIRYAWL